MFSIAYEHISAATRLSNAMTRLLSLIPQSSQHQQLTLDTIRWHNMNVREKLEKIFDILIEHFKIKEPYEVTKFFTDIKLLITLGPSDRAEALNILQLESVDEPLKSEASEINPLIDQTRATVIKTRMPSSRIDETPLSPPEMCEELIMYAIQVSQRVAKERASGHPNRYTDYVISYLKNLCKVLQDILEITFPERLVRQPVVVRSLSGPIMSGQSRTVNPENTFSQFQSQMPPPTTPTPWFQSLLPATPTPAATPAPPQQYATLVQQPPQQGVRFIGPPGSDLRPNLRPQQQQIPGALGIGWGEPVPGRPHAQLALFDRLDRHGQQLPAAVPLPVPLPAPQTPPQPEPQPATVEAEAREAIARAASAERNTAIARQASRDRENARIDSECAICYEALGNLVVKILPCEHFRFHPECLEDWVNERRRYALHPICPLCRRVITRTVEIPFAPPRQQAEQPRQPEQPQSRLSSILRWLTRAEGRHTKHRRRGQNCDGRFCSSKKKRKGHRGRAHKRIITEKQSKKHNITKHRKKI